MAGNQRIVSQTCEDGSSFVIHKMCDEAMKEDTAVAGFYFGIASKNKQSPVNMIGILRRQLVS